YTVHTLYATTTTYIHYLSLHDALPIWQAEALVLRGEHQEHEQDTERINIHRGIAGKNALIGQFGPLEGRALRQILIREFRDECLGLSGTETGRGTAVDFGSGITVVTHRAVGAMSFSHLHQGAERHHLTFQI